MRGSRLVTTKRVVCLAAPDRDAIVERLESVVTDHGLAFVAREVGEEVPDHELTRENTLGVVVGGDGTFLRAIKTFGPRNIPVVGINAGTLAFLAQISPSEIGVAFEEMLDGQAAISGRQQLLVTGDGLEATGSNEVTFQPRYEDTTAPRRCTLDVFVDDEYVGQYEGGGLAINTPTGSTAFALSAGGPVHDSDDNDTLQITPLHTEDIGVRPLVVDAGREITVSLSTPAAVSVDGGRPQKSATAGDQFTVTGAEDPAYIVERSGDSSFMDALESKLGWGLERDEPPTIDDETERASGDMRSRACAVAREAAIAAGEPVQQLYDRIEATDSGTKQEDLLKEAIRQSERITTAIIGNAFPDQTITVEGRTIRERTGSRTWVVDPLDGTGNFVHGNPSYTIAIALLDEGEPVIGVVYSPETEELFHAIRGRGAHRNESRIEPTNRDSLDESMLLSGYDPTGEFLKLFYRSVRGVRRLGSAALHLCFVAAGSADAHWEYDTYPWDVAAGLCILREAGGRATDADGNEYRLDPGNTEQRSPLLTSNGPLHETLLARLESL